MATRMHTRPITRDYRRAMPVTAEQWLASHHGGTPGGWHQRICGARSTNEQAAAIMTAFFATGELNRYAYYAAPIEGVQAGHPVEPMSDDLLLEKAASDGLEDTYREEFLCWRSIDARRRLLRALAQERADNLRLTLALQRES